MNTWDESLLETIMLTVCNLSSLCAETVFELFTKCLQHVKLAACFNFSILVLQPWFDLIVFYFGGGFFVN